MFHQIGESAMTLRKGQLYRFIEEVEEKPAAKGPVLPGSDPLMVALAKDEYRQVFWFGEIHPFTKQQAKVIALLWEAWESGGDPDLPQSYILNKVGTAQNKLALLFREHGVYHKAWGTMIQQGEKPGTYRLVRPE
jgi:hypothetical protein